MIEDLLQKLNNEDLNKSLVNIGLILPILVSLSGIIIFIYKSFIYDSFDLQLMTKEKKQKFSFSKKIFYVLFIALTLLIFSITVALTISSMHYIFEFIILILFILTYLIMFFWSIFFYLIFHFKLRVKLGHKEASFEKFNNVITYSFLLISSIVFSILYLDQLNKKDDSNVYFGLLPIFLIGIFISVLININKPLTKTKYKFIDTYIGRPPYELLLDYQIDNNTSVLSSTDGKYKAIKYQQYNESPEYIIEIYEKVLLENIVTQDNNSDNENNSSDGDTNDLD